MIWTPESVKCFPVQIRTALIIASPCTVKKISRLCQARAVQISTMSYVTTTSVSLAENWTI